MMQNPFAGIFYGLASLAGASPPSRDRALAAGLAADTALLGVARRGASIQTGLTPRRGQIASPSLQRPNARYRELNANGQATGVAATLTRLMLGTGTPANPRLIPPGWQGHGDTYNEARGHLLGRQLGGKGDDMRNIVTQTQRGSNTPQMRDFESGVARRVRAGEVVEYSATPLYNPGVLPPSAILLTAHGSRGAPSARVIGNTAGRGK